MFTNKQFQTLFDFHWDTTFKLLDLAENIEGEAANKAPRSIYNLASHILRVDIAWRNGIERGAYHRTSPSDHPDLAAVRRGFEAERDAWRSTIAALSPEAIEQNITLLDWNKRKITVGLWQLLQHVLMHGMQHHAEIAELLTQKGHSPGDIDLLFFVLDENEK
ncbi:MAG: DinB family protein [Anaerolineae bacterium]|nr:DinB family protein [Anaerolineae bacterium]